MNCPCESKRSFEDCCEGLLLGKIKAETPEQLMRSRYTAYTRSEIPYLKRTLTKKSRKDFDADASKLWAQSVEWKGLKILSTKEGGPSNQEGVVEFTATYKEKGEVKEHHEVSRFERDEHGDWKFDEGDVHSHGEGEGHDPPVQKVETVIRDTPKIGRNDPCSCGSGKKFKKCCGAT